MARERESRPTRSTSQNHRSRKQRTQPAYPARGRDGRRAVFRRGFEQGRASDCAYRAAGER